MVVLRAHQDEPVLPFSEYVFGNSIDVQIENVVKCMGVSIGCPGWPQNPVVLRDSVKFILQRVCYDNVPKPVNNAQKRRIEQFVEEVNNYCKQKALPPLPVSWHHPISLPRYAVQNLDS